MNKKSVIFDMDGTLADTWVVSMALARELNIVSESFNEQDIERLRNLPAKLILKELKIPLHRVPGLLVKGRSALTKRIAEVPLFPGMEEVLKSLQAQNIPIYVMSSNSLENIQKFLANHQIESYFKDIQGGVGVFGKTKSLKRLLKKHGIASSSAIYVGDEVRDVEAAKKAGLTSVAVTWGFNGEIILQSYNPTHIVSTPSRLKTVLTSATKQ